MLRRLAREKVERVRIAWKQQERRIERELGLLKSTGAGADALVYDGTVENQRMLAALGRRLATQDYRLLCWSDPHRNEFRAWVEKR